MINFVVNHNPIYSLTSIYLALLPILVFLLFTKLKNKPKWAIVFLLLLSFLFDFYSTFLKVKNHNTLWLGNIYTISESIILIYFFKEIFQTKQTKILAVISLACISIVWVVQNIFLRKFYQLDFLSIGVESIILIILALYYYFQIVRKSDDLMIYTRPNFWIVTAFLIYAAGTFFLFISWSSLQKDSKKESLVHSLTLMKSDIEDINTSLDTMKIDTPKTKVNILWLKKEVSKIRDSIANSDTSYSDKSLFWIVKHLNVIITSLKQGGDSTSNINALVIFKLRSLRKHVYQYDQKIREFDYLYSIINATFLILKNLLLTVAFLLKEPIVSKKTLTQRTKFLDDLLNDD